MFDSVFGSKAGGWSYPSIQPLTAAPFIVSLILIPLLAILAYVSSKRIQKNEIATVGLWFIAGFVFLLWMRSLYPIPMATIITSSQANSFYTVTQDHTAFELMSQFHTLAGSLPLHARSNMPGKILFFYLLETFTKSPEVMGWLILLISNLGGLLVYLLARQLLENRLSALYAMILYLFLPAKLYHFPILNTVTPVLMLLSLLLFVCYLNSTRTGYLVALGFSLYALVLFEPLPLVTGLIFLALLAKHWQEGRLTRSQLLTVVSCVPAAFLLLHLVMVWTLGFNLFEAFAFAWKDAKDFNLSQHRPYAIWVVQNLKDFFLNAGIAPSLLFLACLGHAIWKLVALSRKREEGNGILTFLGQREVLILLAFSGVLFFIDLMGVNRGETIRLWIFLGVFVQIIAAHACALRSDSRAFAIVLGITVFQAALGISRVGFVLV